LIPKERPICFVSTRKTQLRAESIEHQTGTEPIPFKEIRAN
jgi:hypothetical protein